MTVKLNPLEATFLDWEDMEDGNFEHFAWAMVFERLDNGRPPTLRSVLDRVAERSELLPRFRQRLSSPRVGRISRPRWIPDSGFDVARHLDQEAVSAPGGEGELLAWLAEFMTQPLDRRTPLWKLTLLTDLADGRWAVGLKVHHCMIDGVGGAVAAATLLMDGEFQVAPEGARHRSKRCSAKNLRTIRRALSGARTLGRQLHRKPDPPAGTSLMAPLGPSRHLAFLHMPLASFKTISSRLGGTVNDVALTAIVGGLRTMFEHRGETPLPSCLRVLIPVNLRTPSEARSITMNISFLNIAVPLAEENLNVRYLETVNTTNIMKQSRRVAGDLALVDLAALAPPILQRVLSPYVAISGHFDLLITNVPGPHNRLTFKETPLYRVLPALPPRPGHALTATVCSYSGTLTLGFNADRNAVPDLDVARTGTQRTLERLSHLANESAAT